MYVSCLTCSLLFHVNLHKELASLRALEKDEPISCRDKSMCRL
jgi:hypothetical protein